MNPNLSKPLSKAPEGIDPRLTDSAIPMKIGSVEYKASMLTDRDYGDLDLYIQKAFVLIAVRAADEIDDEDSRRELKSIALREATEIGWGTKEGINIMSTKDGLLHLGYQMILKRHPKESFQQFKKNAEEDMGPSLSEINETDRKMNYVFKKDDDHNDDKGDNSGESGGTSTGNDKSDEGGHIS